MTKISFNSPVVGFPLGLMATIGMGGGFDYKEPIIPIPTEIHSLTYPNIDPSQEGSQLTDYAYLTQSSNEYNVILAVIKSLVEEPTDIDLEMTGMLVHDIWELF
ncbi:MAG: hypothetical protein LBR65_07990 [Culturomica sp.]|jgi:hypothetical protein|nr:hypothetical protein [Culturomica sp.]